MSSLRESDRRNSTEDSALLLASLSSNLNRPGNYYRSPLIAAPVKTKFAERMDHADNKENATIVSFVKESKRASLTVDEKQQQQTQADHDADDLGAALQLLTLKSHLLLKEVRFDETVQVCEFKRCIGIAPAGAKSPLGPTLKYALALDWARSTEYTTRLNDKPLYQAKSLGKISAVPLNERCRLLVANVGVDDVVRSVARQRGQTTPRVAKAIEKQLKDFLSGITELPP